MGLLPNLHAVLIHFPVGLLGAAAVSDLARWAWPGRRLGHFIVGVLYLGGTAGLLAAYLSGRAAAPAVLTPGMAHGLVLEHWNLALGVTAYFGVYSLFHIYGLWVGDRATVRFQRLLTAAGVLGVVWLLVTADRGGELVYRWGVGVAAR